ncbi:hypothetical protein DV738_g178, partial [Chaetothyriales sp. CBS 135597]
MPVVGPQLPPHLADKRKRDDSDDSSDEGGELQPSTQSPDSSSSAKRPRVIGPALPPAPLDERPTSTPKRDEWMTMAPTSSDWSARIDPTKLKNRKFATGSKAGGGGASSSAAAAWHETPEQKQARLQQDDDDPSARPFDREKDIAGGLQINSTRRRELLAKASDFGSRFSAAKYL